MSSRLLQTALTALLALGVAAGASAQTRSEDSTWLPVWNNASGKVEAFLVLEPTDDATQAGGRMRFGNNTLDATFGLQSGDSLALVCDSKRGIGGALGNLSNNCLLAALGAHIGDGSERSQRASLTAAFGNPDARIGVRAGSGRDTVPGWLLPGAGGNPATAGTGQVDVNDLTVFAQKTLRDRGFVTIAGTVAKARLVPAAQVPELSDRWSTKSLSVGGGIGAFGASIVGHVVDVPGRDSFSGLGLGLTWRTPWSGQLTVGADNVVTRGKNPFSTTGSDGEGAVPYVRYEQDL